MAKPKINKIKGLRYSKAVKKLNSKEFAKKDVWLEYSVKYGRYDVVWVEEEDDPKPD